MPLCRALSLPVVCHMIISSMRMRRVTIPCHKHHPRHVRCCHATKPCAWHTKSRITIMTSSIANASAKAEDPASMPLARRRGDRTEGENAHPPPLFQPPPVLPPPNFPQPVSAPPEKAPPPVFQVPISSALPSAMAAASASSPADENDIPGLPCHPCGPCKAVRPPAAAQPRHGGPLPPVAEVDEDDRVDKGGGIRSRPGGGGRRTGGRKGMRRGRRRRRTGRRGRTCSVRGRACSLPPQTAVIMCNQATSHPFQTAASPQTAASRNQ